MNSWIGVDLDGTLASTDYHETGQPHTIGAPVPLMVERVKKWLAEGKDVRIVTARAAPPFVNAKNLFVGKQTVLEEIEEWLKEHVGQSLPITCQKDMYMIELWDDRAIQVIMNTGKRADGQ